MHLDDGLMKIYITIKAILKKKKIQDLKNKTASVFNSISMAGLQDDLSTIFFNMDYSEIPWIDFSSWTDFLSSCPEI